MTKVQTEYLKTILTIVIGLVVGYFFAHNKYLLYAAAIIGGVSIFSETTGKFIHFMWMKLAYALSLFMPGIFLSLLFFLFLTPLALLQKIFRKNKAISFTNNSNTNFININKTFEKESFEKPW